MDTLGFYFLENEISYNLEFALIIIKKNRSRLLVFGDNRILTFNDYKAVRGAKIAFLRHFRSRIKDKRAVKPEWCGVSFNEGRLTVETKSPDYAQRAVDLILTMTEKEIKDLKPEDVAKAVNIDIDKLSRLFKKKQKMSLSAFIRREKLHTAYFIIEKNQDVLIPELSKRLGFKTPRIFENHFKKYYAALPGKFKECVKIRQREFKTGTQGADKK